jgi:hypothetical protein
LPVIRGIVALGESLTIGSVRWPSRPASPAEEEDGEVSAELTRGQLAVAFAMAIGLW